MVDVVAGFVEEDPFGAAALLLDEAGFDFFDPMGKN